MTSATEKTETTMDGAAEVAIVTGGSRGIGRAAALQLALDGYDIALCYRQDSQSASEVARSVREVGANCLARPVDVTDAQAVRDLVAQVESSLGPITAVVAAAGITDDSLLLTMDDESWRKVIDTNLTGTYNVCRAALGPMTMRRAGSIVVISSAAAFRGRAGQANYAASKAALVGFTASLSQEVGRLGVRANVVAPGFVDTDMTAALPPQTVREAVSQVALRRAAQPEEIAQVVSFLCSDQASYITGAVVPVDGGAP